MSKSISVSARSLKKLLTTNRWKRGTLSADFFRDTVGRSRIENAFVEALNDYCIENHSFAVVRVNPSKFLLVSTNDKFFPEDEYQSSDGEE